MRRIFSILFSVVFLLTSCDDGDIITVDFQFDGSLELCGDENSNNYVIYDIRTDPYESLTLLFPVNSTNNLIFKPTTSGYSNSFDLSGSTTGSNRFNYRTYDGDPENTLICAEIPSSDVNVINDYLAAGGTVVHTSTFVDDDNDGIPSDLEDINGNDDLEDDDTDGDGIPNYKDDDDDGDNILTRNENPDPNEDGDFSDAQNTDASTETGTPIPDYLDNDDDGDGVLTRYEDENLNKNPLDDLADGAIIARYLDNTAIDVFVVDEFNNNTFTRTVTVEFVINNIDLELFSDDNLPLGTFINSYEIETEIEN